MEKMKNDGSTKADLCEVCWNWCFTVSLAVKSLVDRVQQFHSQNDTDQTKAVILPSVVSFVFRP